MNSRPSPGEIAMSSVNCSDSRVSGDRGVTCRLKSCNMTDDLLSHTLHDP